MSNKALNWAWEMNINHTIKIVLLALADHAQVSNDKCWPGIERLRKRCNLSKRSVIRSLNKLIEYGLIFKQSRYSEKGDRTSNVYILNTKLKRLSASVARDSEVRLSASVAPKGGCQRGTLTISNKQEPLENHQIKEKESIKEKERENNMYKICAAHILNYLNKMTNSNFSEIDSNINPIVNRMKELIALYDDVGIEEAHLICTRIICMKQKEWGTDSEMRKYLRPKTLFKKENFHQYEGVVKIYKKEN